MLYCNILHYRSLATFASVYLMAYHDLSVVTLNCLIVTVIDRYNSLFCGVLFNFVKEVLVTHKHLNVFKRTLSVNIADNIFCRENEKGISFKKKRPLLNLILNSKNDKLFLLFEHSCEYI